MFRDDDQIKKRLSAYFEKEIEDDSKISEVSHSFIENEFLISKYDVADSIELFATSRKLILTDSKAFYVVHYYKIIGIYCDVPFKGYKDLHILNIITSDDCILKVSFSNVESLVNARNEIYKIINTVIVAWQGSNFRIEDLKNKKLDIVSIPPLPGNVSK